VQGLSEFLPISSSGHLIIVPQLLGWHELNSDNSLNKSFDVALHLGTLVAALWYFRRDVWKYVRAFVASLRARSVKTLDQRLAWLLLLSAIPGGIAGALLESTIEDTLGDPVLIGVNLVVFGLILLWADQSGGRRGDDDFRSRDAAAMGVAQALALAPGVSRSGVTISAGRWCRFSREAATRLSFLMSIPIIGGAALYTGIKLARDGGIPAGYGSAFFWGTVTAAVSGFFAIAVLLRYVRTHSFLPFVIYRVVLGVIVIVVFATGVR
jgi:undecaprenyl-diphosphatase